MNTDNLKTLIREGENSHTEFKSEAVSNEDLAITMISFFNGKGGYFIRGIIIAFSY